MTILDSCRELLEICRVKCGPSDEPILPGGRTNEQAMRDAMTAIEQFSEPNTGRHPGHRNCRAGLHSRLAGRSW